MNILCWNVRGAACANFKATMLELIKSQHMDILFLCEPRISGKKALSVVKSLGFPCYEIVEANGFSGGLWLLWNDAKVCVDVIGTTDQSIIICVSWPGQASWLFSAIYASPCSKKRDQLWEYLQFVAGCHQMPWLLAGDFNEMLHIDEKLGGVPHNRIKGFKSWVDGNDMVDLGFIGPKFTWTNKRVFERLDRAVCNLHWRSLFAEAHVKHLPRTKSDHNPIKVCLQSGFTPSPAHRPFRFEAMWLKHEGFKEFITQQWSQLSGSVVAKSRGLIEPLKQWNTNVFGHLKKRKANLLARIDGIQKTLCLGPNRFLNKLEVSLVEEFNMLLDQEAIFWHQKSRIKWIQEGDRNTNFFHLSTIIRRRRNKIERLKNEHGEWVEEASGIKALVVRYFSSLFSQPHVLHTNWDIPNLFPSIDSVDLSMLHKNIDIVDVKESLFNIGSLKAPGVDGFPAAFYQNHWNIWADEIVDMIRKAMNDCTVPTGLNDTVITLIPKVDSPHSMMQFRPISLCCTLYKVISKIVVARLRPLMPKLISPNQVSFVPGRHITDNIVIAQELMHKFQASKGKKGFVAWKIDLSKAYDKLNWNFINNVLTEVGLPRNLIQLIMACISTVKYQVCVNGELTEAFRPSNGIRQGDPLSPYLFVLCIEKLSHIIFNAVMRKNWKPVKSSQSGVSVSHLFFADDLILFAEASPKQARIMKNCLDSFCQMSGQTVNFDKSAIFCSPNTGTAIAKEISCICGSPLTDNLGIYLGMPLVHSRVTRHTHNRLVDRVHKRLASWKGKLLSLAGRATMIQAVTAAIPIYAMQTAKLPASICKDLDRVNRNFFWGGSGKKQKVHLCQWDLACTPKRKGGLGFKRTTDMNQALLAKTSWRLHCKDQGLWAKIFEDKYLKGKSILDSSLKGKKGGSSTWKGILHGSDLIKKGLLWRIGKGDTVKFWKDHWITDRPLIQHEETLSSETVDYSVANFVHDGWWDIGKLRDMLNEQLVQQIISSPVGFNSSLHDSQIWKPAADGIFTVKSAYELLFAETSEVDPFWQSVWKLKIPPKLKIFAWLLYQGKVLSNDQRAKRHLTLDPSCLICGWLSESILHILRDCSRTKEIWKVVLPSSQGTQFFQTELKPWLAANLLSKDRWRGGLPWSLVFIYTCWYIWKWRNNYVFNDEEELPFKPLNCILTNANDWFANAYGPNSKSIRVPVSLVWDPPGFGYFKLNIDGSRNSDTGAIGAGGVIRNSDGEWIAGFSVNLGKGQIIDAEIWGLAFGLKLAVDRVIPNLIVEMDSATTVHLIQSPDIIKFHPFAGVICSCKDYMEKIDNCVLRHIYREKNCVADCLAKSSYNGDLGVHLYDNAPEWVGRSLADDIAGVHRTRLVCINLV
ncbi:hypothetical protein CerSpe_199640 [Prunus speciosa]